MELKQIKDFTASSKVHTLLLIKQMELMNYKDRQGQYLSILFQDRTGEISCKVWENYGFIVDNCHVGTVVRAEGNIYDYKGILQLQLGQIKVEPDIDPSLFLPVCPRNIEEMKSVLRRLVLSVNDPWLRKLLDSFFGDREILERYCKAPAAKQNHQAYIGGLLEHSLNVAQLADSYGKVVGDCNHDLLITGALLHDIGKIDELRYDYVIDYTLVGRLHGHIFIGAKMVSDRISRMEGFPEELAVKIVHMILSHHGEYEYGSPKRPKFLEAELLFRADMVDFEACKFREIGPNEDIVYNKMLQRFIIK